ncbi:MAG: sterol desaturase family protein [Deltaproteobacteria bacterium]|nr:sterol desaturase family protein [Deltaproteobacteria bacterium]
MVFFLGIFVAIAVMEIVTPRRPLTTSKKIRWLGNIGVVVINTFLLRGLFPAGAVGIAVWIGRQGWGVLNVIQWPLWLEVILTVVVLDFVIYMQHVMFHAVPMLWRFHMMHHADLDLDVTTGTRFHPIEIIISLGIKAGAIAVLGAPAVGVIIFEIILNGMAMFNHGNFFIPLAADRVLRLLVVTPDMHRVHHSVYPYEANSNFGFNLSWWDRFLGTYRSQPAKGHEQMTIGLKQFRNQSRLTLPWMLALPFIGKIGSYAIGRRGTKSDT